MSRSAERSLVAGLGARRRGDLREAAREVGDAFARFQRADDRAGMARALVAVALVALDAGDVDAASAALSRALPLAAAGEDGSSVAAAVAAASRVALACGDAETAARLHVGAARFAPDDEELAARRDEVGGDVLGGATAALGADGLATALAAAEALDADAVLALALARCAR